LWKITTKNCFDIMSNSIQHFNAAEHYKKSN
jgi:hypothetical protein